jgi:hypothetical protein
MSWNFGIRYFAILAEVAMTLETILRLPGKLILLYCSWYIVVIYMATALILKATQSPIVHGIHLYVFKGLRFIGVGDAKNDFNTALSWTLGTLLLLGERMFSLERFFFIMPLTTRPIAYMALWVNRRVYSPLEESRHGFRLLQISPGRFQDRLECSIRQESWQTSTYEALSYVWGDKSFIQPIRVNSKIFFVTAELCFALRHLRNEVSERTIWVDAICINQQDQQERSAQVQKMGFIYQHAKQVVVWLGDPHLPGIEYAFKNLQYLESTRGTDFYAMSHAERYRVWKRIFGLEPLAERGTAAYMNELAYSAIEDLLNSTWWRRVWVVQEVALASKVVFQCSSHAVSWEDLHAATQRLEFKFWPQWPNTLPSWNNRPIPANRLMVDGFLSWREVTCEYTLIELAHQFRGRHASDPRDKLYGLLGLVTCQADKEILPDYTKPAHLIYIETCKRHITLYHNIFILSLAEYKGTYERKLPSWCCDWTVEHLNPAPFWMNGWKIARSAMEEKIYQITQSRYRAAGNSRAEIIHHHNAHVLGLRGFIIDHIHKVGPAKSEQMIWQDEREDLSLNLRRDNAILARAMVSDASLAKVNVLMRKSLQTTNWRIMNERIERIERNAWLEEQSPSPVESNWHSLAKTCSSYSIEGYPAFLNTLTAGMFVDDEARNDILQACREAESGFAAMDESGQLDELAKYLRYRATNNRRFFATVNGYIWD